MKRQCTQEEIKELCSEGSLTVPQAKSFLGIGHTKIYELMSEGELFYLQPGGPGTARLIPRLELERYLLEGASLA